VLLDLSMPTPSGLELLPVILEAHPEPPVIVVTGNSDVEVAVRCDAQAETRPSRPGCLA
jgi:FixJ family two-component response regulator